MKNKQIAFFILPGFYMNATDEEFAWLVRYLEEKNIRAIKVSVRWKYSTLTQNAADFEEFYTKHKAEKNYILGFSYGAVIALMVAQALRPDKVFLCSLSPGFSEDKASEPPQMVKYIGRRRFADMETRSGRQLARGLKVPSIVLYGEEEARLFPQLKKRCEETAKLAIGSRLVVVPNAPHQIDFPSYIDAIKKEIKYL